MIRPFVFDKDVAIAAVLYIAKRLREPTFHNISKIMYFADKAHLQKYGRFISGDSYVAMKHGPVPSATYDLLKAIRDSDASHIKEEAKDAFKKAFSVVEYKVTPRKDADLDYLSESDIECLDQAVKSYGHLSFGELTDLSHDAAWHAAQPDDFMDVDQIASTLDNADDLLEHLRDPHPG